MQSNPCGLAKLETDALLGDPIEEGRRSRFHLRPPLSLFTSACLAESINSLTKTASHVKINPVPNNNTPTSAMGLKILAKASRKVLMTQDHLTDTTPTNTGRGIYCAQRSLRSCYHLVSPRDINGHSFQTNGWLHLCMFPPRVYPPRRQKKQSKARRKTGKLLLHTRPELFFFFFNSPSNKFTAVESSSAPFGASRSGRRETHLELQSSSTLHNFKLPGS